jgi:hypothetical protein
MCMGPKKLEQRLTESFPSFALKTHKLYILRHCINIVFILQKIRNNPWMVILRIK